jgi:tight adherence protein B
MTGLVLDRTERVLSQTAWWSRFKLELHLAQITMPAEQIVVLTFIGTGVVMWLIIAVTGSFLISLVALVIPIAVRAVIARKLEAMRRAFGNELPENLMVLSSAIRAGHSFVSALTVVAEDAPEPGRTEFRRVVAQEQLGVPIEDALREVVERMQSPELEQVALVAALQRDAGGNTAEVLDRVTETIRERAELRRLVRSLTAQGRMSRWIVSALPVALGLLILLINPSYMKAMFNSGIGQVFLVIAGVMVVSGSLVIRKIINIKV